MQAFAVDGESLVAPKPGTLFAKLAQLEVKDAGRPVEERIVTVPLLGTGGAAARLGSRSLPIAALIDMLFLRLLSVYCRTELVEAVPPGDALKVAAAAAGLPLPLGFARNQATLIVASRSAWVARICRSIASGQLQA